MLTRHQMRGSLYFRSQQPAVVAIPVS